MNFDPSGVYANDMLRDSRDARAAYDKEEEERRLLAEQEAAAKQQAEQQAAISKDSHAAKPAKEFGAKENFKEVGNAIMGGIRDTASSIATAPERAADMASGEMEKEDKEGDYRPDWDPLGGDKNPINKTWWGGMLRGGVHFGTMALALVGASKIPGVRNVVGKAASTGLGKAIAGNSLAKAAVIGAGSDLVSEYSQDDNISAVVSKHVPWLEPLATKDSDHPALKTLKNVVEGMGIGLVADGIGLAIGKARNAGGVVGKPDQDALKAIDARFETKREAIEQAAKEAVDKNLRGITAQKLFESGVDFNKLTPQQQLEQMAVVAKKRKGFESWSPPGEDNVARAVRTADNRAKSVDDQIVEKAEIELNEPEFRGHKNKPIADPWQGAPNSTSNAYNVSKQLKRIHLEWGAKNGSTDSIITPAAAERMASFGIKDADYDALAKDMLGDLRYQGLISELRSKKMTLSEVYGDALDRMQEVMGREATSQTAEEFWEPIIRTAAQTGGEDNLAYWATREVVAADLINGSLFKQIRDLGIAAREIHGVADVMDIDGPMKTIRDRLIVGLENTKRSRYLVSNQFRDLKARDPATATKQMNQFLGDNHAKTVEAVDTMMALAQKAPTDDFLQAILEAFSMSNKINNFTDLEAWVKGRIYGMDLEDGTKQTGALIKELEGVMVNSVLSGPKTPVRAVLGTSTATFTRPLAQAFGGLMRGDTATLRSGLAGTNAMMQAIPEAFTLFKTKLGAYWAGDIADVRTRFSEYSTSDENWKMMGMIMENSKNPGDVAAYRMANMARTLNHNSFFTYSTKIMAATDDAFGHILGRARARELALREAMDMHKVGDVTVISKEVIQEFEDRFMKQIFDADGNITDAALKYAKEEVTLTNDLSGWAKSLNDTMTNFPWTKPFYLFARTGINGLNLMAKHTPLINAVVKEQRDIMFARPDDLTSVSKYGIQTAADLDNAKALIVGRQAIGSAVISMAVGKFMSGEITGNGPQDRQLRKVWEDAGWKPRSIKLGDVWVSYDAFEPFNGLLAAVADVGDSYELMGPEWVELNLLKISWITAQAAISKSYLTGLTSLTDLIGGDPTAGGRIAGNILNNSLPLGGLRNDIGKIITPYTRELNSGIGDAIRNRNLYMEQVAGDPLPIKYDIFNGKPIRDHDFMTRMFNAVSPVQFNLDDSPGRTLMWNSNYDLRVSVNSSPTGVSLAKDPKIRSLFQRAIGNQNMEQVMNDLAGRRDVQDSVNKMVADRNGGRRVIDPMKAYLHNDLIRQAWDKARKKAWAEIQNYPEVKNAVDKKRQLDRLNYNTRNNNTTSADDAMRLLQQQTNR
jgi:hypothetical protein